MLACRKVKEDNARVQTWVLRFRMGFKIREGWRWVKIGF